LLCLGRHTVTNLLSTAGAQFQDWSAAYRLFSQSRLDVTQMFSGLRSAYLRLLPDTAPLCLAVDDSLLPKTGIKIPGTAWRRDPQGPPFQTNLIRAQRVLQFSALLPLSNSTAVRGIPVDFLHAPTVPKLKKNASEQQKQEHQKLSQQLNLSTQALNQLEHMRPDFGSRRPILLSDARFTTKPFLRGLSEKETLIGRIRKDAKLFYLPHQQPGRGRRRLYGDLCPTPEQIRQDNSVPWQQVSIHAAGADHDCKIKVVDRVIWKPAGAKRPVRLIIIAPLAYRPRQGARLLYRDPAFLICTDLDLNVQKVVQYYFWRWDIEVNFREQKSLLGVGHPQVRNPHSCQEAPAFQVAVYAMLLLAAARCQHVDTLPRPKWQARSVAERVSTARLIRNLRFEVWGRGLGLNDFPNFCPPSPASENPEKFLADLPSAVLYA
jgi:hypothetical protein